VHTQPRHAAVLTMQAPCSPRRPTGPDVRSKLYKASCHQPCRNPRQQQPAQHSHCASTCGKGTAELITVVAIVVPMPGAQPLSDGTQGARTAQTWETATPCALTFRTCPGGHAPRTQPHAAYGLRYRLPPASILVLQPARPAIPMTVLAVQLKLHYCITLPRAHPGRHCACTVEH